MPQHTLLTSGLFALFGGLFLFLWCRTVVALPVRRRPEFVRRPEFKWLVPLGSAAIMMLGIACIWAESRSWSVISSIIALLAGFCIAKFDRYSAQIRILFDRYRHLRSERPDMQEVEALFRIARWRYPGWSEDRLVELVAGKDIEGLILLIIINENQIHPISDWELYRSLKTEVAKRTRVAGRS